VSAQEISINEKSAQRRRKHCTLAIVRQIQKISPAAHPLPGGSGRPKYNQLEMVTTFTYKPRLVRIDAPTNKQIDRGDYNTLRRSFASAQCNYLLQTDDRVGKKYVTTQLQGRTKHIGSYACCLLHCALAAAHVYCNWSCLFVCVRACGWVGGWVCLWVCYHDNSKFRSSQNWVCR